MAIPCMGQGQNCDVYIPIDEGTTLTYANFNAKGKKESEHKQTLVSKTNEPGATVFVMRQEVKEKDQVVVNEFKYRCEGDRFVFDMNSFVDPKQKESFKDSQMEITFDAIDIPYGAKPGTVLKDGSVTISVSGGAAMPMAFKTAITDRQILAKESITTAAGTFECLKLSQTVVSQIGFVKVSIKSVQWIAKNVGMVKSESYSKADKLLTSSELVAITR